MHFDLYDELIDWLCDKNRKIIASSNKSLEELLAEGKTVIEANKIIKQQRQPIILDLEELEKSLKVTP